MVKEGRLRRRKYEGKFDADVVKQRFDALKGMSVEQETAYFAEISSIEDRIKRIILEPRGIPTHQIKDYLLFARSLYGLTKQFTGETLRSEELGKRMLFMERGLDEGVLREITKTFGITPLPTPTGGIHGFTHAAGGTDPITLPLDIRAIPDLDATKIVSGRFQLARMPDGPSGYVLTGKGLGNNPGWEPVPGLGPHGNTHAADGTDPITHPLTISAIPDLDASKITSGVFDVARIPDLDASKITSGVFDPARIPGLDASKIVSGVLSPDRIPGLDASKIVSGVLSANRIPDLDASKITSGRFPLARMPDGPSGYVLTAQGTGVNPVWAPPSGVAGTWQKVAEVSPTTDVTEIDITGLDLDAAKFYMICYTLRNPTSSTTYYRICYNGDFTATNYYRQHMYASGTGLGAGRGNDNLIATIYAGVEYTSMSILSRPAGQRPTWSPTFYTSQRWSNLTIESYMVVYYTETNVTRITIRSDAAGGIAAGSKVIIFKVAG